MKKSLAIISLLTCGLMAQAHQVLDLHTLHAASDSVSATPVMKVENVDGGVRVTYQFNYVYVDSATTDGRTTYTYSIEDFGLAHEAGVPALPGRMDAIALSGDGDIASDALAIDVSKWPSDVFVFNLVANGFIVDTLKFNPMIFVRFSQI